MSRLSRFLPTLWRKPKQLPPIAVRRARNVNLSLFIGCILAVVFSISYGSLFDTYLYMIHNDSNTYVGYYEGTFGLAGILSALPVGFLVDYVNRVALIKISAFFLLAVMFFGAFVIYFDITFLLFFYTLSTGMITELVMSATEAVFTDCVGLSLRVHYFTLKGSLIMMSYATGPILCAIFFSIYGNKWVIPVMKIPLLTSNIFLGILSFIGLLAFQPLSTVSSNAASEEAAFQEDDPVLVDTVPTSARTLLGAETSDYAEAPGEYITGNSHQARDSFSVPTDSDRPAAPLLKTSNHPSKADLKDEDSFNKEMEDEFYEEQRRLSLLSKYQKYIPFIIYGTDVIRAIGAGATVKFLGLFFMNDYGLKPAHVTGITAAGGIATGLCITYSKTLSHLIGRTASVMVYNTLGIILVFVMAYVQNLPLLILVCVIRGAIQSSTFPINRSIIMDYTSTKYRGRWNAVESLVTSLWSASAILGGLISDEYDYRNTFLITGLIYSAAFVAYAPVAVLLTTAEDNRLRGGNITKGNELAQKNSDILGAKDDLKIVSVDMKTGVLEPLLEA